MRYQSIFQQYQQSRRSRLAFGLRKSLIAGAAAVALTSSGTLYSHAQESADDDPLAEDQLRVEDTIIVKGQKRDTTLQDADIAVTVFTPEQIEISRIRDFRRIDDLVPNVQFNQSGQTSSVFATIRGIESSQDVVNRAAIYIDGIPFRELSNAVLDQIESIEVLRGPQSTLYGANTEAGLFVITTRQPTTEFEADIRATASFFNGDNAYNVNGFIGGPIVEDQLTGSLVVKYADSDAYLQNPFAPEGANAEIKESFVQGRLLYTPNDSLTLRATAYMLDIDAPGVYESEFVPLERAAFDDNVFFNPFTQMVEGTFQDLFHQGRRIGKFEFFSDVPKQTDEQDLVIGMSLTNELSYGKIDAALSYADLEDSSAGLDTDITAFPFQVGFRANEKEIWSGELRFTSPDSDVFEYLIGTSWYQEDRAFTRSIAFFNPGIGAYNDFAEVPELFAGGEDYAFFGSTTFGLGIDGLFGTLGLRYDHAERESSQEGYQLAFGLQTITFLDVSGEASYDQWLPRAALRYEPNDNLTLYANVARGYVPGGFNLAASADPSVAEDILQFGEESIWNYEMGLKTTFPNGRGYLNLAAFFIESDGWQEFDVLTDESGVLTTPSFISSDANIDNKGFEIELVYDLTDQLQAAMNFGYTDAVYRDTEFVVGGRGQVGTTENLDGVPVKLVPEYDFNAAAAYDFGSGLYVRAEANLIGETPLEFRSRELDPLTGRASQDAIARYNLYAGFDADRYSIKVFVENLTNERVASGLAFPNLTFGFDGTFYAPVDPPRVIGVEFEARF
ncbi:MAG: TonB-dependent receptor [Pseudomonadota bacterium]